MRWTPLFSTTPAPPRPVNVASVPQRSPFRYPGGKTWFVPVFRDWLAARPVKPALLIEPFAGGGIIGLTALFENLAKRVLMVERDEQVAAVWQTVVRGESAWLADKILSFTLTAESARRELEQAAFDTRQQAFQTILKNRIYHGGIMAAGSGMLKYGEQGKGILSRWYPETLAKRLYQLDVVRSHLEFRQTDGLEVIEQYSGCSDAVFFIDPPYTAGGKKAGKRLYKYFDLDHERLFGLCGSIAGDFLMTYDNAEEVKALARRHGFEMRSVPMKNTHHAAMTELVIGKDLAWLDELA